MFVLWMFIGDKTLQLCHAHCILKGDKNANYSSALEGM